MIIDDSFKATDTPPTYLPQPRDAVSLKAAQVAFLLHVSFIAHLCPWLHFVILMARPPLFPLVRDVAASLCTSTSVVAFASAPRHVTPDAIFQSDFAGGAGLVFIVSSAAYDAPFLLAIQRKDKQGG